MAPGWQVVHLILRSGESMTESVVLLPDSLVKVVDSFAFASTEGIYLSDISTPTLISERLKETWKKMNRRRLHQIAGEFYDHKLRMDLPFGSSTVNNIRIIYDSIRKCLYLQECPLMLLAMRNTAKRVRKCFCSGTQGTARYHMQIPEHQTQVSQSQWNGERSILILVPLPS